MESAGVGLVLRVLTIKKDLLKNAWLGLESTLQIMCTALLRVSKIKFIHTIQKKKREYLEICTDKG